MNRKTGKWMAGILCALMLFTAAGCGSKEESSTANLDPAYADETVIGTVEGVAITRGQLMQRVDMLAASMAQQYQIELSKEEHADFYDSMKDAAFEDLTLGILLDKEAEKEGFKISDADMDSYMSDLETYAASIGKTTDEYLASLCATKTDLQKEYSRNKFVTEKRNQMIEAAVISDEEAKEYYDSHIMEFTTEGGIQISHILVAEEEKAKELIAQLENGADFAELAKENSTDTGSAVKGGDVGITNENTNFVPEFKEAALALEPGEFTHEPVKSTYGYHILKAGERTEESVQPFETAKPLLVYNMKNMKGHQELEEYAENLKAAADIQDLREEQDKTKPLEVTEDEAAAEEPAEEPAAEEEAAEPEPAAEENAEQK